MRAFLLIRHEIAYRRNAFERGLRALGYQIMGMPRGAERFERSDVLVIWNRYAHYHNLACRFEAAGARVIVAENGPLGRDFLGEPWYAITLKNPLAGGEWPQGSPDRWASLGVRICEWRNTGEEIIILNQRGIGPPGVRQPDGWAAKQLEVLKRFSRSPARVREHPGERPQRVTLEQDLENALAVVTWASGAAFKALLLGVPVFYGYEKWVGREAGDPIEGQCAPSLPQRLPTFEKLAWSMWRIPEIEAGQPFRHLLGSPSSA